ncbi:MAG: Verru_Chthon cassette protein B [Candidatus Methylacidiphilales bacterium]|nr:Verru_Chthon cassette protein B [Candidatus Methylacidiphilales bacterium]
MKIATFATRVSGKKLTAAGGFSLIEVVLALGVMSMSLMGMLGLTLVGLTSMREAMDQTVLTQIVQRVSSEVQLTPFDKLDTSILARTFYFNAEAIEQTAADDTTRFVVTLSRQAPSFPQSGTAQDFQRSLASIRIFVNQTTGVTVTPGRQTSFAVLVPNSGEL